MIEIRNADSVLVGWRLDPNGVDVLPVEFRPARWLQIPQVTMLRDESSVTGFIFVTRTGDVTCSGWAREWLLLLTDLQTNT